MLGAAFAAPSFACHRVRNTKPAGERMDLHTITLPLYEAKRWIKFLGGVLFALGVAYALTIVGLVVAWLLLWLGVLLWQVGAELDRAFPAAPGGAEAEEVPLAMAFVKLRRFFVVAGIATLVYLVVMAVGAVTMLVLALLGMV